jgi:hypothetical protein
LATPSKDIEMKHITWPAVAVFITVLAALATIFGLTDDAAMRQQILRYFDSLVPFILGIGAGAAAGGAAGYASGFIRASATAKAETAASDTAHPQPDTVRRAAEVVRVAADESHQAADEARAAAAALRMAAEEGRAVAELQRSLLAEGRRAVDGGGVGSHASGARLGVQGMR